MRRSPRSTTLSWSIPTHKNYEVPHRIC